MSDTAVRAIQKQPTGSLIGQAAVAVDEAALRIQELELYQTDNLHLTLIRRALDALDEISDNLEYLRTA
jgi:hypothetical protein